jgi:hypothetical protein
MNTPVNDQDDSNSPTKTETSYFYEQLGAPTLLYRTSSTCSYDGTTADAADYIPQMRGTFHSWQQGKGELEDLNFSQAKIYAGNIYDWVNRSNRARMIRCFPNTLGRIIMQPLRMRMY